MCRFLNDLFIPSHNQCSHFLTFLNDKVRRDHLPDNTVIPYHTCTVPIQYMNSWPASRYLFRSVAGTLPDYATMLSSRLFQPIYYPMWNVSTESTVEWCTIPPIFPIYLRGIQQNVPPCPGSWRSCEPGIEPVSTLDELYRHSSYVIAVFYWTNYKQSRRIRWG